MIVENNLTTLPRAIGLSGMLAYIGEPHYNRYIVHPVCIKEHEDDTVSINIGRVQGEHVEIDSNIIPFVKRLHKGLSDYLISGDHDGIDHIEINKLDNNQYIVFGASEGDALCLFVDKVEDIFSLPIFEYFFAQAS